MPYTGSGGRGGELYLTCVMEWCFSQGEKSSLRNWERGGEEALLKPVRGGASHKGNVLVG